MVRCDKCGKSNPPNRAACLYCAAVLAVAEEYRSGIKLNFRELEGWENGFNIVFMPPADGSTDAAAAARYLRRDEEHVESMLRTAFPFPLARIESGAEAEMASEYLYSLGVTTQIVKDVDLKIFKPNVRLRAAGIEDGFLRVTLFNTGEHRKLAADEIVLIVVGRIVESKTEAVEKRKKDERKVLSETATSSDDLLIDLYAADGIGYRIMTKGFDFSSLGPEKRMIASENIQLLLGRLKKYANSSTCCEEFSNIANTLSLVWDIEKRKDFEGIKRAGVWRSGYANVVRTSNLEQFNKYSHLQRICL